MRPSPCPAYMQCGVVDVESFGRHLPLDAYPFSPRYFRVQDRYGLSWQITPAVLGEVMTSGDAEKIARVTQAFLPMKKFDVAATEAAANS